VHIVDLTVSCDYTGRPLYTRVIRSKAYHDYVKVLIISDAICNVNERDIRLTYINMVKLIDKLHTVRHNQY